MEFVFKRKIFIVLDEQYCKSKSDLIIEPAFNTDIHVIMSLAIHNYVDFGKYFLYLYYLFLANIECLVISLHCGNTITAIIIAYC